MKTARGDVVYQCDTCKRKIRVPQNQQSFDVVQRCIITENCPGKLYLVTTVADINSTPVFPPEVPGLQDWFQRKVLFDFTQTIATPTWTIVHNLGCKPLVQVLVNALDAHGNVIQNELPPDEFTVKTIDLNSLTVTFSKEQSGIAQCIATASANLVNPQVTTVVAQPDLLLTNSGLLTIATTNAASLISVTVVYKGNNPDTTVSYVGISNVPTVGSPWVGTEIVHIGGRNYHVRSFNILTTIPGPTYFSAGLINNGSPVYFVGFSPAINENFILLGESPFSVVDRISDRVIDIASIDPTNPATYYNQGALFSAQSAIKSIYPPVIPVV